MIVSEREGGEVLCIPQSEHAAISGQLARAWGNERFGRPEPWTEVCLAAACHDDGMDDFDAAPELDPETGLPRDFMRMPLDRWLGCWRLGPAAVAEHNAYAGVLVSLHGTHLLGYRRFEGDPDGRAAAEAYRQEQGAFRAALLAGLRGDLALAGAAEPEALERNRGLIALWDAMSLAVCVPRLPQEISGDERPLQMREAGEGVVSVDPWPFTEDTVELSAHGRRLDRSFSGEAEMRAALADAEPEPFAVVLRPA